MKDIIISGNTFKGVSSIKTKTTDGNTAIFYEADSRSPNELILNARATGMVGQMGKASTVLDITSLKLN